MAGRIKYVPRIVIEDLEQMKQEFHVGDSQAFKKMGEYAKVGREVEKMKNVWTFQAIKKRRI